LLKQGASWPAMHNLAANWIPPNERSKFVTAYMGMLTRSQFKYFMPLFLLYKDVIISMYLFSLKTFAPTDRFNPLKHNGYCM
jgi:hypothetical protein